MFGSTYFRSFKKKLLSIVMALVLLVGMVPVSALASEGDAELDVAELNALALETLDAQGLKVVQVSLGGYHSAAIAEDGSLWTWGYNYYGQLGDGTTTDSSTPIKVMDDVVQVALGWYHSVAVTTDGSLWTWGANYSGQLGDGTTTDSSTPIKVLDDVIQVSLGGSHSAAVTDDGSLWTWGSNYSGQLGNGALRTQGSTPIKVMDDVVQVSLGNDHSAAITEDGSLWIWGDSTYGQLGNGSTSHSPVPVKVMDDVVQVSLGNNHSAAITEDGSLWTWGDNTYGQLGDGTTTRSYTPVKVMDDVVQVSLGNNHSAAITEDGSLWMWGYNFYGQLGDGTTGNSSTPIKVMEDVVRVSLASGHSAAITEDGSLWMWGWNNYGQLGDGTTTDSSVPIQIIKASSEDSGGDDGTVWIVVDGPSEAVEGSKWEFAYDVDFDIPTDVVLLGGEKINLNFADISVAFERDENTFKVGIGLDYDTLSILANDGWDTFKKFVKTQKDSLAKSLSGVVDTSKTQETEIPGFGTAEMSFWGYVEGTFDGEELQIVEGNLSIKMEASVGVTKEWQTVVWVIPVVVAFTGELGVDASASLGLNIEESEIYVEGELGLTVPGIKLTAGVGIAYVADIGVYGSVEHTLTLKGGTSNGGSIKAALEGEAGIRARALLWEAELSLIKGTWTYYDSAPITSLSLLSQDISDFDTWWTGFDRDTSSAWYSRTTLLASSLRPLFSTTAQTGNLLTLQESVYDFANPVMVQGASGTKAIVFEQDISTRSDGNQTALSVSLYDDSSSSWSEPVIIEDDGTADYDFDVAVSGDTLYVVWSDSSKVLSTTEASSDDYLALAAANTEISAASVNLNTGEIESIDVSSASGSFNTMPSVYAGSDGTVSLAWVSNASGDAALSGTNTIMTSSLVSGGFSKPTELFSTTRAVTSIAYGELDGKAALAVVENLGDDAQDAANPTSLVLVGTDGSSTQLATGVSNPQFAEIGSATELVWYQASSEGASFMALSSANAQTETLVGPLSDLSSDYSIINGDDTAIVLSSLASDSDEGGSDLVAYMVGSDTDYEPVVLTDADGYVSYPTGVYSDGAFTISLLRSDITITDTRVIQDADLCVISLAPEANLQITSAEIDDSTVLPGSDTQVTLTVVNNGLSASSATTATVYRDSTSLGTARVAALQPGETTQVQITTSIPADFSVDTDLDITVQGASESYTLTVGKVDMSLVASGSSEGISAKVTNIGAFAANAVLHVRSDSSDGNILATSDLGEIEPGSSSTVSFTESQIASWDAESVFVTVETEETDMYVEQYSVPVYVGSNVLSNLDHIRVALPTAEFEQGKSIDLTDVVVTAIYEDGSEAVVSDWTSNASEIDTSKTGTFTDALVITYEELGQARSASITITITEDGSITPDPDDSDPSQQDPSDEGEGGKDQGDGNEGEGEGSEGETGEDEGNEGDEGEGGEAEGGEDQGEEGDEGDEGNEGDEGDGEDQGDGSEGKGDEEVVFTADELAGADRYATMAAIVSAGFDSADVVVLATGEKFPDALAASGLAGYLNAPIVLTGSNPTQAIETISSLGASHIYVLGDSNTISDTVLTQIKKETGATADRIAGDNRQETALAINELAVELGATPSVAIITNSENYADALSISPYAWATGASVFLTESDHSVSEKTIDAIRAGNYETVLILGDKNSVTEEAEANFLGAIRLEGDTRYETSVAIAEYTVSTGVLSYDTVTFATGENFPDALAGGPFCGVNNSVLLLVNENAQSAFKLIAENASSVNNVYFLGNENAVSATVRATIVKAARTTE